ncbi:MAG: hypothetical protein IKV48_02745, partial [Eggerthellaceae bacterium]|nr:hypothetical protein [Eggerthellaceae bacterium]
ADILEVANRGRYCTLWLDSYPSGLKIKDKCLINGIAFEQAPVHYNFGDAERQLKTPYIAVVIEDRDIAPEWFAGSRVERIVSAR